MLKVYFPQIIEILLWVVFHLINLKFLLIKIITHISIFLRHKRFVVANTITFVISDIVYSVELSFRRLKRVGSPNYSVLAGGPLVFYRPTFLSLNVVRRLETKINKYKNIKYNLNNLQFYLPEIEVLELPSSHKVTRKSV